MKKKYMNALRGAGLALMLCAGTAVHAERFATEDFNYSAGNLVGQGGWMKYNANNNDDPIQLVSGGLTYAGYQDEAVGLAATLTGPSTSITQQRLQKELFTNETARTEGATYYSLLVNVSTVPTGDVYFFAPVLRASKAAEGIVEGKTGSEYGRIFVCKGDDEGKFKFGVSKNGANAAVKSADMEPNTTYLLVLKFEIVDGTTNDIVSLWINPADGESDPAGALTTSTGADPSTAMGLQGIELRQGTVSAKTGASLAVDAIRVADTYADLWGEGEGGGGDTPEPPAPTDGKITAAAAVDFEYPFQFQTVERSLTVKAEGISGPVSVSAPAGFTPSVTTIAQEEAEAGYELLITYKANTAGDISGTLTLSAEGAEPVNVALTASVAEVTPYARLNFFQNLKDGDDKTYMMQGKATVTYVDAPNQLIYMQDIYGAGGCFSYAFHEECPVAVGDRVTNFYCMMMEKSFGATTMLLFPVEFGKTPGYTVEPLELSLKELGNYPEDYIFRLVKVNDVTFADAGSGFSTASTSVSDATGSGIVRSFAGTDLIGTTIPATATSLTGISTSASAAVVTMRSLSDLEAVTTPVDAPAIEVSVEPLVDASEYQPINHTVELTKVTIAYTNLERAAQIYLTGTNRAMFAIDAEEIPSGTGTLEFSVSYTPTAVGQHKANILIDAVPTELSQSFALSARAYDPGNLPQLSADPSVLEPFAAKVGETHTQTFTYTVKDMLDYGNVKIVAPHAGQFLLNSASLMKYDGTYNVTVSFTPKQPGTYTETIELSGDLCEPVSFRITGTATGAAPVEDVQGDVLTDDTFRAAPQKLVVEDFNNCGGRNKPLSIQGWTNTALEGSRAWWAYNPAGDDNFAAKVTAYDMLAADETDATMLLLSPALDYKNADERLLTFNVMGDFMAEGGTGYMQVVYIDAADVEEPSLLRATGADALEGVYIEPINGLNIPSTSDYNGEWANYVIDLEGLDLADTFFIGFSYSAPRGKNFPSVYYLDDFSWGRTDVPFIRTDVKTLEFKDEAGERPPFMDVNVKGISLTDDIAVSITGQHASQFTTAVETLPKEGGNVRVHFSSDNSGLHEAYLKLSHAGAPDTYVALSADNDLPTGIEAVAADGDATIEGIFTLSGLRVSADNLPAGVYIVKFSDGTTRKQVIK